MIQEKYTIKPGIITETNVYLGSDIVKVSYPYGSHDWTMIYVSYVKIAVNNVRT